MKIRLKTLVPAALVLLASSLPFGVSVADGDHPMTDGTIRKVDTNQGKVTIKHGPIANLEMPPMTMVFGLKDPSQLEGMAKGDAVRFYVVDEGGKMIIEELEKAE